MALSPKARKHLEAAITRKTEAKEIADAIDAGGDVKPANFELDNGAELEGTYSGNVFLAGDATLKGDVVIKGDLFTEAGTIYNLEGWAFEVQGRAIVDVMQWHEDNSTLLPQVSGNLVIKSDLIFNYIYFHNKFTTAPLMSVGGNLFGKDPDNSGLELYGYMPNCPGVELKVGGDVLGISYVDTSGQLFANAGNITVSGDYLVYESYAVGGYSVDDVVSAGNGGDVNIWGNFVGSFDLSGGYSQTANGANGGNLWIGGNATVSQIFAIGGDCSASGQQYGAGSGGSVEIDGAVSGGAYINVNGGDRYGDADGSDLTAPAAYGGNVNIYGSVFANQIVSRGGSISVNTGAPTVGGSGGTINLYGGLNIDSINIDGGSSNVSNAGNGGSFSCYDKAIIGDLSALGGEAPDTKMNGSGGNVYTGGGLVSNTISMANGEGAGTAPLSTAQLTVSGSSQIGSLNMSSGAFFSNNAPIMLQINSMGGTKKTLGSGGNETPDVTNLLSSSIFTNDSSGGTWLYLQAVAIPPNP